MRKEEIISLVLIIAAVVVLIIGLQMDYGSARKWMTILSFVLLALSLNPKSFWKKKKTQMVSKYTKRCSISLEIREMQTTEMHTR